MKKHIYTLVLVCISGLTIAQSQVEELGLDLMREYDPQSYSYYQYNDGIKTQGKQIAESIAGQLDYYSSLSETNDPTQLVNEFNSKMNNIDQLEAELDKQATNYLNNQAGDLGNQLNSGDYMGALGNVLGSIEGYSEIKRAEKELAQQRAKLQRQKQAQMSEIYRKKFLYTKRVISQLRQQAAFAESKEQEAYFLASIDYVWCSYYSSYCDQPQKPASSGIANKFVAQDVLLKQTADRKLALYTAQKDKEFKIQDNVWYFEEGINFFLDGAIAFAAKAATEQPSADNYIYLAQLQTNTSNILAFSSIMVAQSIDANALNGSKKQLYNDIKDGATREIDQALRENNTEYLDAFLKAGLDKTIKFNGKSLLVHAIAIDNPDAVQLILNHYIEGLNQDEINKKVQKAIMLSAAQDSPNTIKRFIELGVPTEFALGNYTPIELAAKVGSAGAMQVLISNSNNPSENRNKFANSLGALILNAREGRGSLKDLTADLIERNELSHENLTELNNELINENAKDAKKIAKQIDELSDQQLEIVVNKMIHELNDYENYFNVLGSCDRAKMFIKNNPTLLEKIRLQFGNSISMTRVFMGSTIYSDIPSLYISSGLIDPLERPFYSDYTDENPDLINESLPYAAAYYNNSSLFGQLSGIQDLNKVKNKNGISLAESLEKGGPKFASFKILLGDPFQNFLELGGFPPISLVQAWTDPKTYRSKNEGSLFHIYIEQQKKSYLIGMIARIKELINVGVDKALVDKNGKTAHELLLDNEKFFKDKYEANRIELIKMSKKEKKEAIEAWWIEITDLLK